MRRLVLAALSAVILIPGSASANVDLSCPPAYATSAVSGIVKNARGVAVPGIKVELYATNSDRPAESGTTDAQGRYRMCAGQSSGIGHNTYDVHATDVSTTPLYAAANQPYSTWSSPTAPADFTPESGVPLLYMTNLTVTPQEISTANAPAPVTWTVRSKAPADTTMKLTLDHLQTTITLGTPTQEGSGPAAGGWNVWTHSATMPLNSDEKLYFATARGTFGSTEITQIARRPYTIDNRRPVFGPAGQTIAECGPGATAPGFSPAAPAGTTNPQPIVTYGACDFWSSGARSGLDPFSVTGKMCRNLAMTTSCVDIKPVLSVYTLIWFPDTKLALGDYYLTYSVSDQAGNRATSAAQLLRIAATGGQRPVFSALTPSNIGSGDPRGIVIGSQFTSPSSLPVIGFRLSDADGQNDLEPGSLRVRIYYMNENNLVYDYDPSLPIDARPHPITKKGGGAFDVPGGLFRASGMPLQITSATPPGRYIASASITDRGGNSATVSWHWILLAAL